MDKINTIVLEGGGIYGLAYIGALKELQKRIDFNNIKYLWNPSKNALDRNGELWIDQQRHREGNLLNSSQDNTP